MIDQLSQNTQVHSGYKSPEYPDEDVARADELLRTLHNPYTPDDVLNAAHHDWCTWYRTMPEAFKRYIEARYAAWFNRAFMEVL